MVSRLCAALLVCLISSLAHADPLVHPNIVFILTDDQTMETVAKMPFVSSRDDWLIFDNAFLEVALCCPSRSTILSGLYSHHHHVEGNGDAHLLKESDLLPVWLHLAGYQTSLMGKYLNGYPFGRGLVTPPGWDDWHALWPSGHGGDRNAAYFTYSLAENGGLTHYGTTEADYSTDVLVYRRAGQEGGGLHRRGPAPLFPLLRHARAA
jgi:arylsulfatase A-like enzyme